MRPGTILWFERLYFASAVLGSAAMVSAWLDVTASEPQTMLLTFTILTVLPVTLALLASRRRSRVALVLLVFLTGLLGGLFLVGAYRGDLVTAEDHAIFVAQMLTFAATFLLFTPSARAWRRRDGGARSVEALERTFE
jgi:hypothetical protein